MKNIFKLGTLVAASIFLAACSLDKSPVSQASELTLGGTTDAGNSIKFKTKSEMQTQYDAMYNIMKGTYIELHLDFLIYSDTHADNSYRGATDSELTQLEQQKQDGINKNIDRDWGYFYKLISAANSVICNVDSVPDEALTLAERKQWKAEALIMRSMFYFDMVRLWGDIPLVITEPPAINSKNIEQVYPLYYPKRDSSALVYRQIIKDLNTALEPGGAPAINPSNKFVYSRTLAYALLAKIYAEKPVRDYAKVIAYSNEVEKDVTLNSSYGDLYEMNASNSDVNKRNTPESIFEVPFSGGGNWLTWLYGIDASDPASKYDWAKWCTPTRDLIKAFDDAGDVIRKNQTIKFAAVTWSNHYPANNYPHMYKYRSKFHSIVKFRLADILLLKAEAYLGLENKTQATSIVNQIRSRVKLPNLATVTIDDILKERRLELAFEGQRWFDLVRTDKVFDVMNTLNKRDSGRLPQDFITPEMTLLPIPQAQIDLNPSMVQNPGY